MAEVKWSEGKYNLHYLTLGKGALFTAVEWDETNGDGYKISVGRVTLRRRVKDLDLAKKVALQFMDSVIEQMLLDLKELRSKEKK